MTKRFYVSFARVGKASAGLNHSQSLRTLSIPQHLKPYACSTGGSFINCFSCPVSRQEQKKIPMAEAIIEQNSPLITTHLNFLGREKIFAVYFMFYKTAPSM